MLLGVTLIVNVTEREVVFPALSIAVTVNVWGPSVGTSVNRTIFSPLESPWAGIPTIVCPSSVAVRDLTPLRSSVAE